MSIFNVPEMSCGHCKAAIQKAISAADHSATVAFDMEARTIDVSSSLSLTELSDLLANEGYPSTAAT